MYPRVETAVWNPFPESAAGFYYLIQGLSIPLLIAAFLWMAYTVHRGALARESAALRELELWKRLYEARVEHGVGGEGQAAQERPSGEGAIRLRRGGGHGGPLFPLLRARRKRAGAGTRKTAYRPRGITTRAHPWGVQPPTLTASSMADPETASR